MENQKSRKDKSSGINKTLKKIIVVGVLIVSLSIVYWLVVFLPNKEKSVNPIRAKCINDAIYKWRDLYNVECKSLGLEDNCRLPYDSQDRLWKLKINDHNACF